MQIRKFTCQPHHIASTTVLCGILWLICPSLSLFTILSRHLLSVLLHAEMVPNRVSVFICLHPPSHDALWLPTLGLPRPVRLCLQFVSLSLTVSLFFPPLSMCFGIPLIFSSLAGQGATKAEQRRGEEGRNLEICLALIFSDFFFPICIAFAASSVLLLWRLMVKDGRAWAQTQR